MPCSCPQMAPTPLSPLRKSLRKLSFEASMGWVSLEVCCTALSHQKGGCLQFLAQLCGPAHSCASQFFRCSALHHLQVYALTCLTVPQGLTGRHFLVQDRYKALPTSTSVPGHNALHQPAELCSTILRSHSLPAPLPAAG